VLHKITGDKPAPEPSEFVADYPSELAAVVMKALAKDRDQRFATADEMFAALQQACPDAFAPDIATRVKDFMTELVGDRAALRREVLRRAQLIADSRAINSGTFAGLVPPGTSQSASSLRALAIDSPVVEATPSSPSSRSALMTLPAPPQRSRSKLGFALLGAALLGGALVVRATGFSDRLRSASQPHTDMVELKTDARAPAAPSLPPPSEPAKAPETAPAEPRVAETAKPEPAPSAASAAGEAAATGAKPSASALPAARKSAPPKRPAASSKSRELIAPDYAR
jgi:serine/threonine-protein kinase